MIIYPHLPSGHTIFCDDIRHEMSNKVTLVGIYSELLLVSELPLMLPRLCAVVTFREATDSETPVTIRLIFEPEDGEEEDEITLSEISYEIPPEAVSEPGEAFVMREGRFYIAASPLMLPGKGRIKVRAQKGEDQLALGSIKVGLISDLEDDGATSTDNEEAT